MAKILILGGTGFAGRLMVRHLLTHSETEVTIATRHIEKSQAFAEEMNKKYSGERVAAVYADAADAESLRTAFRDQTLVVIAAPTTAHAKTVVRIAIETGVDYLDVQVCAKKFALLKAYAEEIKRTGRCFITEAGFHPGLPSAMVRYAACHFDKIENAITAGYLNMGISLPYSEAVDEVAGMFKEYQTKVYTNSQWTKARALSVRKIDFGGDIGWKRCYPMFLEELRPLPILYPSLTEVGFFVSELHWVTDWLITPLALIGLKFLPGVVRPIGKFLWWGMGTFHKPPYRVEIQVQASGVKHWKPLDFRASVAHSDGYALTAIPVVATLLQYLDGSVRKPGLWMMGHCVEPIRLMRDMEKMGLQCMTRLQ